jgi:aminoglycoside phosphotransferase (APT) family kinase protein
MTCDNALERPFILMEALRGESLTALLDKADRLDFARLLRATGEYMSRMHAITFQFPGYITLAGAPASPPDPATWGHPIWTYSELEKLSLKRLERDAEAVSQGTLDKEREFFSVLAADMKAAFEPPHFTHGDCHAHQFFLDKEDGCWVVTGVVDMEVSSSGDAEADFGKFAEILPGELPAATRWWEPLFEGYGREPSLDLLKFRMAACGLGDGGGIGYHPWPGNREQVLAHVLSAQNWFELFDLRALGKQPGK